MSVTPQERFQANLAMKYKKEYLKFFKRIRNKIKTDIEKVIDNERFYNVMSVSEDTEYLMVECKNQEIINQIVFTLKSKSSEWFKNGDLESQENVSPEVFICAGNTDMREDREKMESYTSLKKLGSSFVYVWINYMKPSDDYVIKKYNLCVPNQEIISQPQNEKNMTTQIQDFTIDFAKANQLLDTHVDYYVDAIKDKRTKLFSSHSELKDLYENDRVILIQISKTQIVNNCFAVRITNMDDKENILSVFRSHNLKVNFQEPNLVYVKLEGFDYEKIHTSPEQLQTEIEQIVSNSNGANPISFQSEELPHVKSDKEEVLVVTEKKSIKKMPRDISLKDLYTEYYIKLENLDRTKFNQFTLSVSKIHFQFHASAGSQSKKTFPYQGINFVRDNKEITVWHAQEAQKLFTELGLESSLGEARNDGIYSVNIMQKKNSTISFEEFCNIVNKRWFVDKIVSITKQNSTAPSSNDVLQGNGHTSVTEEKNVPPHSDVKTELENNKRVNLLTPPVTKPGDNNNSEGLLGNFLDAQKKLEESAETIADKVVDALLEGNIYLMIITELPSGAKQQTEILPEQLRGIIKKSILT